MRKLIFTLLLFVGVGFSGAYAQCNHEALLKDALSAMGDGQYIKDFIVDIKEDKADGEDLTVKYSVILNSRSQYKFNVVNGDSNSEKVHMQLFDGDRMLVSNKSQGKIYSAFGFRCGSTKVYSLVFSFPEGSNGGCARAVQSLQKQFAAGEGGF